MQELNAMMEMDSDSDDSDDDEETATPNNVKRKHPNSNVSVVGRKVLMRLVGL